VGQSPFSATGVGSQSPSNATGVGNRSPLAVVAVGRNPLAVVAVGHNPLAVKSRAVVITCTMARVKAKVSDYTSLEEAS